MNLFNHKKEQNFAIAAIWIDLEGIMLSEKKNQSDKDKYYVVSLTCGI